MRPGISLLALYGSLHQSRRTEIYDSFMNKEKAVLFATDIAGRGLGKGFQNLEFLNSSSSKLILNLFR